MLEYKVLLTDCKENNRSFSILRAVKEIEKSFPDAKCLKVSKCSDDIRAVVLKNGEQWYLVFEENVCILTAVAPEEKEMWVLSDSQKDLGSHETGTSETADVGRLMMSNGRDTRNHRGIIRRLYLYIRRTVLRSQGRGSYGPRKRD